MSSWAWFLSMDSRLDLHPVRQARCFVVSSPSSFPDSGICHLVSLEAMSVILEKYSLSVDMKKWGKNINWKF